MIKIGDTVYPLFDRKENIEYFQKKDITEHTPLVIVSMRSGCVYFSINGVESLQYNCFIKRVPHKPPFNPVLLDEELFTL